MTPLRNLILALFMMALAVTASIAQEEAAATTDIVTTGSTVTTEDPEQERTPRERDPFEIGIKVGANSANVYDTRGENFVADPKLGLAGGGFMYIPIVRFIGFQPEFMYSQKGFEGSGTIDGDQYTLERTTAYIDVPLMLAIRPVSFFRVMAGPQYSYLLYQRDNFTSAGMNIQIEQEFENDNIRQNIMGLTGGFDFYLLKFVISGRAGWDVMYNKGDGTSSTPRYKNVWVQATVGLRF